MLPALALMSLASAVAFDVDAVGLSSLERAAIEGRARAELSVSVELVAVAGLAGCPIEGDVTCAAALLASAGLPAGAAVRVVKVLQVVRVELAVLDATGALRARSSRTLDVDGAATGHLFDDSARAALAALSPATRAGERARSGDDAPPSPPSSASPLLVGALAGGIAGVALAAVAGVAATNEALLANSPSSSGDEKERARVLGPIAVVVAGLGVAAAVAASLAFVLLGE